MYAKKHPNTVMSKKAAMYAVLQNLNKIEYPKLRGSTFDTEVSPKNAIPSSTECMGGCPTNYTGGAFMSVSFMGCGGFLISLMHAGGFLRSKILLVGKLLRIQKTGDGFRSRQPFSTGFSGAGTDCGVGLCSSSCTFGDPVSTLRSANILCILPSISLSSNMMVSVTYCTMDALSSLRKLRWSAMRW